MTSAPRIRAGLGALGTIRLRLTAWFLLALAALVVAGSVTTYLLVRQELIDQASAGARDLARAAAAVEEPAEAPLDRLTGLGDRIWLIAPSGLVVARSAGAGGSTAAEVGAAIRSAGSEPGAASATVVRRDGLRAVVLRTRTGLDRTLDSLRWTLLVVGLIGLLLAAVPGALLAWRALRPVDRMREEVDQIPGDALSRRLPEGRRDELGRLARAFNRLLARAEAAAHEQERFVADASHELKTPVTAIEGHARVVSRALEAGDREQARESAAVVASEARRLAVMLRELLALAESGSAPTTALPPTRLDLAVAEACDEMRALEPGRSLEARLAPVTVAGDHGRLRELALVLMDNAFKYSPDGSAVRVSVTDGERPSLVVSDRGSGLSDDDRARAFERFFRGSASRGIPGSGLGLAIARAIGERHCASVSLGPADDGGTEAVVTFPRTRPP